jgi:hypothetical protein
VFRGLKLSTDGRSEMHLKRFFLRNPRLGLGFGERTKRSETVISLKRVFGSGSLCFSAREEFPRFEQRNRLMREFEAFQAKLQDEKLIAER